MSVNGNLRKAERFHLDSVLKSTKPSLVPRSSLKRAHCCDHGGVIFKVPGSLRIHPSLWGKEDVIHWLRWAEGEYSLQKTDDTKFVMNGRGLCILTKNDFKNRSPNSARTTASQTTDDFIIPSSITDTNQDGPLNLSCKKRTNQEKDDVNGLKSGDHADGKIIRV